MSFKKLTKLGDLFLTPALVSMIRSFRKCNYSGNYPSWAQAYEASLGYDAPDVLIKIREALLKVKKGEAAYERDSVLFDEVHYSWPLLSGLLLAASSNENYLDVLDYGGSLGSTFFQNRKIMSHIGSVHWSVVEQQHFVRCGREHFQDEVLRFYNSVDECLDENCPNVLILSSVLPYLEKPYEVLCDLLARGFPWVIIDRTPLLEGGTDRLTVQKVPEEIYPASYPAWFLSRAKLLSYVLKDYEIIVEFEALAGEVSLKEATAYEKGMILKRI